MLHRVAAMSCRISFVSSTQTDNMPCRLVITSRCSNAPGNAVEHKTLKRHHAEVSRPNPLNVTTVSKHASDGQLTPKLVISHGLNRAHRGVRIKLSGFRRGYVEAIGWRTTEERKTSNRERNSCFGKKVLSVLPNKKRTQPGIWESQRRKTVIAGNSLRCSEG